MRKKKIIIVEFWNVSPHLDGGMEIAISNALAGSIVDYIFIGKKLPYVECYIPCKHKDSLPREDILISYVNEYMNSKNCHNLRFITPEIDRLPKIDNLCLEYDSFESLKELNYDGFTYGESILGCTSDTIKSASFSPGNNYELINSFNQDYLITYLFLKNHFYHSKYDLCYVFNGRYPYSKAVTNIAKKNNIEIRYHEKAVRAINTLHITKVPVSNLYNYKETIASRWKKAMLSNQREEFIIQAKEWFDRRLKEYKVGFKSYKYNEEIDINSSNLSTSSNDFFTFSFFCNSPDEFLWVGPEEYPRRGWDEPIEAILDIVSIARNVKLNFKMIVRIHPNLETKDYLDSESMMILSDIQEIEVIPSSSKTSSYSIVKESDVVFTVGSTIGIESVYLGVPSVLMSTAIYEDLESTINIFNKYSLNKFLLSIKQEPSEVLQLPLHNNHLAIGHYWQTEGNFLKFFKPIQHNKSSFNGIRF